MAFVNPAPSGGFGVGAEFTSGEANLACNQIALALDKSIAGDQLSGVVTMAPTAAILANTAGAKIVSSVASGIQSTVPNGLVGGAVGAVASGVQGGIALTGGANDYPIFPPRTITRCRQLQPATVVPANWASSNQYTLIGSATTGYIWCLLDGIIDGSTLNSVTLTFRVFGTHAGGVGGGWVAPFFSVFRYPIAAGLGSGIQTMNPLDSGIGLIMTAVSGPSWFNGGLNQAFTYGCVQNNVINRETFGYAVAIQDETGPNSQANNTYLAALSQMTVTQLQYD